MVTPTQPTAEDRMNFAFLQEPPFCFTDGVGATHGCDVELARRLCDELGIGAPEMVETEFAELLPGLAARRWTMTTGLFVSQERKRLVDFTRPIWSLRDGFLVETGNPRAVTGYRAIAADPTALLGVIADQVQHSTALANGVPADRMRIFATQAEAARAVASGRVHAYASVAMAHRGYMARNAKARLEVIEVPVVEKEAAFGAFALAKQDAGLTARIDARLGKILGSDWHRAMMARYGFSDTDIDRVL